MFFKHGGTEDIEKYIDAIFCILRFLRASVVKYLEPGGIFFGMRATSPSVRRAGHLPLPASQNATQGEGEIQIKRCLSYIKSRFFISSGITLNQREYFFRMCAVSS